jgi:multidrug efflux pump subunit AcrA (membrane-fusion protein)
MSKLKGLKIIGLCLLASVVLSACQANDSPKAIDKVKQVTVVTLEETAYRETLVYDAAVSADQITPLNPSRDGEVETIYKQTDDMVKAGDKLLTLKAYVQGEKNLDIFAPYDGYIASILTSEGNLVSSAYPAIIVRTSTQNLKFAITLDDVKKVQKYGEPQVEIQANGKTYEGKFKQLSQLPDSTSLMYPIELSINDSDQLQIGEIVKVNLLLSRVNGVWLPIPYIQNDGDDFVYIVNSDSRVERRNIVLMEVYNELVHVTGLNDGDRVITIGNAFVKEGQLVNAREATNE